MAESPLRPLVLDVDDDEATRYASSRILRAAGYRVIEATTGLEALERVRADRPDLVVLDVKLPDISGLEVCRRIKQDAEVASTPVLQMSASFVNSRDTVRGLESGADAYLTEPLEPAVLVATVASLLRVRRAEQALRDSEASHRLLFESNPLPTWVFDAESLVVLAVNRAAVEHYGYSHEEFLAMRLPDICPADEARRLADVLQRPSGGRRERWRHLRKDRSVIDVEVTATSLAFAGRRAWLVIAQDVTDRRRAEQARAELLVREQAARTQAESANRAKDEFLAMLSHELRTPLSAVFGWVRMLRARPLDTATSQRAVEAIERNTALQAKLIDDLLDVSRIITGNLAVQLEPVDVAVVVGGAVDGARAAAEARGLRLTTDLAPDLVVAGDANRLQQVVANLLANATKFTPPGGAVDVRVARTGSQVDIVVRDTGRGIAPDFLPHLFERFRQADSSTTRSYSGLGLGLAIVRHIVELHGGAVRAESAGEGRGATLTVSLPLAGGMLSGTASAGREAVTDGEPDMPSLHGLRVLVVDDHGDTRDLLGAMLEVCGASVTAAASSQEALDALDQSVPDVLVSDIAMAVEDGYELIRRIRRRPPERGGAVPAVAVTAYAMEEDVRRALAAGFQLHVAKPVDPRGLAGAVSRLTHRA
jgi:PAS domain S-box-containing protein